MTVNDTRFLKQISADRPSATRLGHQHARAIGTYLDREPLHNIYLIHGLQELLEPGARNARPDRQGSHRSTDVGAFWSVLSGRTDEQNPGDIHDETGLNGLLFSKPEYRDDHNGSHRKENSVGYLASVPKRAGTDEALACLGMFAARSGVRTLIGHQKAVRPAIADLDSKWLVQTRLLHFYQADPERLVRSYAHPVRQATTDDIPGMIELYRGYEFSRRDTTDDEIRHEIETSMDASGVYFVVEAPSEGYSAGQSRRIVSAARIFPETEQAGLIGAARTLPECRGQGIYLTVRTACFEYLFAQDKIGLGMFLDSNTSMHRVIEKQGGTILAEWLIADLRSKHRRTPIRWRRRLVPLLIRQWIKRLLDRS